MEILLYLGHPCLFLNLGKKMYMFIYWYINIKKIFSIKTIFLNIVMKLKKLNFFN